MFSVVVSNLLQHSTLEMAIHEMNSYNSFNLLINLGYCRVTQIVKEWKLTKTNVCEISGIMEEQFNKKQNYGDQNYT
ncbi:hypothetical protein DV515_00000318 [Chloebia gouldiae]|uniref:Uncharacterized protein n=1 Tax=Chloebia gouldiae TaxID=44316 RepID=A0A3L8T1K2_CHLGU|nr:hypothetical protein DV515_00000318 [Chloebia gouldiae]